MVGIATRGDVPGAITGPRPIRLVDLLCVVVDVQAGRLSSRSFQSDPEVFVARCSTNSIG